jgi:hypothetical protein
VLKLEDGDDSHALSDYPTDNAFVEAFLYEKKNWIFFPFFFILKERMFDSHALGGAGAWLCRFCLSFVV